MRGTARRAIRVDVQKFGWDRSAVVTLRHSTLPWYDEFVPEIALDATPLSGLKDLGTRDRLSLTGQFAAHQAFLQFAGVRDAAFDPAEWAVVRKRSTDCRLVRIAARSAEEPPPLLTSIQQFASAIAAPPLDVFRQSWGRAETAYHEVDSRLREDVAADLRWLRCAALGSVVAPGTESLRALQPMSTGRWRAPADLRAFRALAALDRTVTILGDDASPLTRYSGVANLEMPSSASETEIVERVLAGASHRTFVLTNRDAFDDASRRVVDLLKAAEFGLWLGDEGQELSETALFVLSPRLEARRALDGRKPSAESLAQFVASPAFDRYLDHGELPASQGDDAIGRLREPFRSYTAAVALLGERIPVALVNQFLDRLMSTARAADLVSEGVSSIRDGELRFASPEVRQEAMLSIPTASRPSLCRVAAEIAQATDRRTAALLLTDASDLARASSLLETMEWRSADDVISTLRTFPRDAMSPRLREILADALVASGRYRDARAIASDRLLAKIDRRTGQYAAALERVDRIGANDFESVLLRAELLLLLDRTEEACAALDACQPRTDEERLRHGYHRAVLANDVGERADDAWLQIEAPSREYYGARIAVYRGIASRDLESAVAGAKKAVDCAASLADRIDATLDLLFSLFCSGDWVSARSAALDALLLVEETQGDRAAGGILFMLAYLAADDGQWTHATHLLERLRDFYSDTRDGKRLLELELIAAAIDMSRGAFESAERPAKAVLAGPLSDQIREAAALILDEVDWIEGRTTPLRSTGATANIELTDRHSLLLARRGLDHPLPRNPFDAQLLRWEESGGPVPAATTGSQKLMLFRAALGRGRKDLASALAAELEITMESPAQRAVESELRVLRAASALPYPFGPNDFAPAAWRYATRNRLGQWQEIGSLPALQSAELDSILAEPGDNWVACSDRELLHIEDLGRWSAESRDAIAALFRVRAEHHRLSRLMDEEPLDSTTRVEGVVGESPAMREIFDLISRVSRRDVAVCILGESGTGKEMVARGVHRQSARRQKPFTPINCAALPENLIESELFGHVRGAFTGADRDRAGLIETTDGGTLFLDEIGEMPLAAQAKLLRFLQEGEFRRVGETTNRTSDVRIVTATNRKLEAAVEEGRFREDLYYRIRGVEIVMPPLRDRASDIPLLAAHFLTIERQKHRAGPMRLSSEVEAAFASYHWPGNVRELQNTIRGAHALAGDSREIALEHLPERLRRIKLARMQIGSYQDAVARFRRELIEKSLAQANGNQNQAAAMLKISRQALAYQIRELGILVTPSKRPQV
ncbi:MAG: sigma 54-interacting transcriptional regulator [Acidobacteriota bacterium]|nr:sigma 54-interacting transcriptional regulator [Acidobacteriota bacterium]